MLSCVWQFLIPWTAACQASLSFTNLWSLLKLMSIEPIQPSHPLSPYFSSCPQSFSASGSFLKSQLFTSGDQSIGASASVSVFPINIQDWFPLGLTGLISLLSKGLSRVFFSTTVKKHQFFGVQPSLWSSSHIHTYGKTIALTIRIYVGEVMSLLFNMLSKFVRAFLPRSKCLLISWLQSPSAVILEPKKIESVTVSIVSLIYLPRNDGTRCHDLSFLNVEF